VTGKVVVREKGGEGDGGVGEGDEWEDRGGRAEGGAKEKVGNGMREESKNGSGGDANGGHVERRDAQCVAGVGTFAVYGREAWKDNDDDSSGGEEGNATRCGGGVEDARLGRGEEVAGQPSI
jgi:hypothetical protein